MTTEKAAQICPQNKEKEKSSPLCNVSIHMRRFMWSAFFVRRSRRLRKEPKKNRTIEGREREREDWRVGRQVGTEKFFFFFKNCLKIEHWSIGLLLDPNLFFRFACPRTAWQLCSECPLEAAARHQEKAPGAGQASKGQYQVAGPRIRRDGFAGLHIWQTRPTLAGILLGTQPRMTSK